MRFLCFCFNRRTLNERAVDIMKQLKKAEVGRRPIIWITHSAGGNSLFFLLLLSFSYFAGFVLFCFVHQLIFCYFRKNKY